MAKTSNTEWLIPLDEERNTSIEQIHDTATAQTEALCEIDYRDGEIASQAFSLSTLTNAIERYDDESALGEVYLKLIEVDYYGKPGSDTLLALTDEQDGEVGVVVAPRKDEYIGEPGDESLTETHNQDD